MEEIIKEKDKALREYKIFNEMLDIDKTILSEELDILKDKLSEYE